MRRRGAREKCRGRGMELSEVFCDIFTLCEGAISFVLRVRL